MFKFLKTKAPLAQPTTEASSTPRPEIPQAATKTPELELLKKQVVDQEEVIRELVIAVTFIANHKRFEHIQEVLIRIHNKLDKMTKF
jgi:hypothetical protein